MRMILYSSKGEMRMGYNAPNKVVSQFQLKGRYARQYLSFAGSPVRTSYSICLVPVCTIPQQRMWKALLFPAGMVTSLRKKRKPDSADTRTWISNTKAFFFNGLPAKTAAVKAWLLSPAGIRNCRTPTTRISYGWQFARMPLPLM